MELQELQQFYKGRRVFVTGHTGFKGSWLVRVLQILGAKVTGYALRPPTEPSLFRLAALAEGMGSNEGDVRDFAALQAAFAAARPEVVLHLAAQPIVLTGYRDPRGTYETNVMGTVNLLDCVRLSNGVQSVVNVTTDKVYRNNEWAWGYRENEALDGFDPYSNSKSCSELVTHSYRQSFLDAKGVAVSTARAGNVIGGGDFAPDRILPDCVRQTLAGEVIGVRNPHSVRPYQHVLEPVCVYLLLAARQAADPSLAGCYNVGPAEQDAVPTGALVDLFCKAWGPAARWEDRSVPGAPHEANYLKLDTSLLRARLGWQPRWSAAEAVEKTVEWSRACLAAPAGAAAVRAEMDAEIQDFFAQ